MSDPIRSVGRSTPQLGPASESGDLTELALRVRPLNLHLRVLDANSQVVELDGRALMSLAVGSGRLEQFLATHCVTMQALVAGLQEALIHNQVGATVDLTGSGAVGVKPSGPARPPKPSDPVGAPKPSGPVGAPKPSQPLTPALGVRPSTRPQFADLAAATAGAAFLDHPGFARLPAELQARLMNQIAARADLSRAYRALLDGAEAANIMGDSVAFLLWQASHYQSPTVCSELVALAGTHWWKDLELPDRQRATKIIAHDSAAAAEATSPARRTLLRNTLDVILAPRGRFALDFSTNQDPTLYGSASLSTLYLDRNKVTANNAPLIGVLSAAADDPARTRIEAQQRIALHLAEETLAHEVNHLVNGDQVADTYGYFLAEYGAWYAGFVAVEDRAPTSQEAFNRCQYLLTATTGAYAHIRSARLQVGPDGKPGAEARSIIAFMGHFFAPEPSASIAASAADIVKGGHAVPNRDAPAPLTPGPRNLDNTPR